MRTQIDILLIGGKESMLYSIWEKIANEIERLHNIFNRFDSESELSRLRLAAMKNKVEFNNEWTEIFQQYLEYHNKSNQIFDITLGQPETLHFDLEKQTLQVDRSNKTIDFGGYAKGYAAMRIEQMIRAEGIENALINFGNSSITAIGHHPHGEYWPITICDPYTMEPCFNYKLRDSSISSSGNAPRHEKHIFNPQTKQWIEQRRLVCIESCDPLVAEVLSTICTCLSEEEAKDMTTNFEHNTNKINIQQI